MKHKTTRRQAMTTWLGAGAGLLAATVSRPLKAATQQAAAQNALPKNYDPTRHRWLMALDVDRCIGCGSCVKACKAENKVPTEQGCFRTWIERYVIKRAKPGSDKLRGEISVDSPNGALDGFPPSTVPAAEILKAFFVPKLCNLCTHSPCVQACPVGATFDAPDGTVLVDYKYCIGCGFCIQACPYGCRFFNHDTHTADKCTLCYHRITRGLKPACVEVCPGGARIFGDLRDTREDNPLLRFIEKNKVQTLKAHLGTEPRVMYANLDGEVR
ncbi:MAG: 4Fe-4S dicluster domain-containing protein [Verrucomicrobiota bacterium]